MGYLKHPIHLVEKYVFGILLGHVIISVDNFLRTQINLSFILTLHSMFFIPVIFVLWIHFAMQ